MEEMNNEMMVEENTTLNQDDYDGSIYEDQNDDSSLLGAAILMGAGALIGGGLCWGIGKIRKSKLATKVKSKFSKKDLEPFDVEAIEVDEEK